MGHWSSFVKSPSLRLGRIPYHSDRGKKRTWLDMHQQRHWSSVDLGSALKFIAFGGLNFGFETINNTPDVQL